jgi:hypothetical protein
MINGLRKGLFVWGSNLCWNGRGWREEVGIQVYDHQPLATDGRSSLTTKIPPHISKITPTLSTINAFKNYSIACGVTSGKLALKLLNT